MHNKRSFGTIKFTCRFGIRKACRDKDSEWKFIQWKAASTIMALALAIKNMVLNERTPTKMSKKLDEIYAPKSLTNFLYLEIDLYTFRMEEGGDLHDHINEFNSLVCQLLSVEEKVSDEEQAIALLASLP